MVSAAKWPDTFDRFIGFRRKLCKLFGLRVRAEVKANYLLRNTGPFATLRLTEESRRKIYRMFMRMAEHLDVDVFAVVIQKQRLPDQSRDPRDIAWEYMLQRLERASTKSATPIMLVHDEGENLIVRKLARKARRWGSAGSAFGTGSLSRPARLLVDDPVPRNSSQSYFIQLADLAAYAAFRACVPPGGVRASICPASMWSALGNARYAPATSLRGSAAGVGIVEWP